MDIRPADQDEMAFTEYNPGEEPTTTRLENVDPALRDGSDEDEITVIDTLQGESRLAKMLNHRGKGARRMNAPRDSRTGRKAMLKNRNASIAGRLASKSRKRKVEDANASRDPGVNPDSIVNRYISVEPGKAFQVCFTWMPNFKYADYDIQAELWIDGLLVIDKLWTKESLKADEGPEGWKDFIRGAIRTRAVPGSAAVEHTCYQFQFGQLDIGECPNEILLLANNN